MKNPPADLSSCNDDEASGGVDDGIGDGPDRLSLWRGKQIGEATSPSGSDCGVPFTATADTTAVEAVADAADLREEKLVTADAAYSSRI